MSFNVDTVLGALLVGTWGNSVLYTIEVIQACGSKFHGEEMLNLLQAAYYYRHFKHDDNWKLKLLVSSAIAIDSVSMVANYASVYLYIIIHWGEIWRIYRTSIGQFDPLYVLSTGIVAALAQSFLTARYWLLARNKFITVILFFFIIVAAGGAFAGGVTLAVFPKYKDRNKATIPATTWLITEAVTDISIAAALLWELRKVKSSFKQTRSLVKRLVAQTIQTGSAGASVALAVFVAFLANKESNVPTGIAYILGRVYCITMLANLNNRKTVNTWSSRATSSVANLEIRGERGDQERSEGGIHVHRTAMVHIETAQECSTGSVKTNPGQGIPDDSLAVETTATDSASYSSKKKQDLFAA
ncbi:hypothetical protein MSAN_00871600 [Mycena sanguinolenta]|uniref:DUF6534 domain-containing protein n=1 Tax=Mycena sanguinolenta TaxID=230812 RepID=A0A8H6YZI3_9AGAR|nr:hypothetical protein MSAN_00871600 [Mycena sanguinolenta]